MLFLARRVGSTLAHLKRPWVHRRVVEVVLGHLLQALYLHCLIFVTSVQWHCSFYVNCRALLTWHPRAKHTSALGRRRPDEAWGLRLMCCSYGLLGAI